MTKIILPSVSGGTYTRELTEPTNWQRPTSPLHSRRVYAAAHVIPDVTANNIHGGAVVLDWDTTMAFRRELWSYGLGVADAMDTAQRGMGLDWATTRQLIKLSGAEAAALAADPTPAVAGKSVRDLLAVGAGTDQLALDAVPNGRAGLERITDAYREQIDVVQSSGAKVIIMASRALARVATSPEDYLRVYSTLLREAEEPVVLHWLGPMFDPALAGYWGTSDQDRATEVFLDLIGSCSDKIDGIKVSLLDAAHETKLRDRLPESIRLYTGDDFNYPELMAGDGNRHSDALLGIFAAIYPAASSAVQAYDSGNPAEARAILDSTRALGLHMFAAPTIYYKTGVAFLAWLNGHQPGFQMVSGLQANRSVMHLCRILELADETSLLVDPELAASRMRSFLTVKGVIR